MHGVTVRVVGVAAGLPGPSGAQGRCYRTVSMLFGDGVMYQHPSRVAGKCLQQRGFTLIELMVTVSVLAVLAGLAIPSFTRIINSNRIGSQANDLVATLQYARSEALRSNRRVTVCRSTNASDCAANGNHWIVRSGGQVQRSLEIRQPLQLTATSTSFDFLSSGMAASAQTFTLCLPVTRPEENARIIQVARSGQLNVQRSNAGGQCP